MAKNNAQDAPPAPSEEPESQPTGEVEEEYTPKELPRPAKPDKIDLERELRKYVKRAGGFRRGLPKEQQTRTRDILKLLDRRGLSWDTELIPDSPPGTPGPDTPSVTVI